MAARAAEVQAQLAQFQQLLTSLQAKVNGLRNQNNDLNADVAQLRDASFKVPPTRRAMFRLPRQRPLRPTPPPTPLNSRPRPHKLQQQQTWQPQQPVPSEVPLLAEPSCLPLPLLPYLPQLLRW